MLGAFWKQFSIIISLICRENVIIIQDDVRTNFSLTIKFDTDLKSQILHQDLRHFYTNIGANFTLFIRFFTINYRNPLLFFAQNCSS
jgi:hypothetical protein